MTDAAAGPDAAGPWAEVLADAAAITDQYRDRGWDVTVVEPRDVAPAETADRGGFAVLVADDEYDRVADRVGDASAGDGDGAGAAATGDGGDGDGTGAVDAGGRFDDAEVYRRGLDDAVLAIAVERDPASEVAVVVPLYYLAAEARAALEAAQEGGELLLHLRPESSEDWVTFSHDDPSLFVPDDAKTQ